MKTLECSSKGDKRFSAFYAKVKVFDKFDSIENHYQLSKRFKDSNGNIIVPLTWKDSKGKTPVCFVVNDIKFETKYLSSFYALLWAKYLDSMPSLVKYASEFDDFKDMFSGKSINSQANVIKKYVKEGRVSLMKECNEFIKLLSKQDYVKEEVGDLLKANADIKGHQTNGLGLMGAGLALQIRNTYPHVFFEYQKLCKSISPNLLFGQCQIVETEVNSKKYIANLFGQIGIGVGKGSPDSKEERMIALNKSLVSLKEYAMANNLSVGLPYQLGCGLAGGDWNEVLTIIKKVFNDYPVTIYKLPGIK
ncbi:MAG: hypothetical protein K0R54_744 [Clostridiaceae bacterium]|jgi:O-acetyl-ADP-ribose deacetylase (regulator of RNase III)|nr:hypothetical protein [Clostridiaceae bacterium]